MSTGQFKLAYTPALDGLRGIAIIAVMLFHAESLWFKGGFIGVDIFFVLSGFLITSILIQEFDEAGTINLKNFYMRRILRLAPALLLLLVVYCLIIFFLKKDNAINYYIDALISLFYLSNWARAFDCHPPDLLGHTWSLSIEEQFYILWSIVLLMLLRLKKSRWLVLLFAFMIAIGAWLFRCYLAMNEAPVQRLYNGLDTRADGLMAGCTLGILLSSSLLSESLRQALCKWFPYCSFCAIALLFFFIYKSDWRDLKMYYFYFIVIEVLVVFIILDIAINKNGLLGKILSSKGLVWVGSISYGLYLWHYPIYRALFVLGFKQEIVALIGTLLTFLVAACSYYYLEKPIRKFRNLFSYTVANHAGLVLSGMDHSSSLYNKI
jgi:peptidoglycan/LPS O-acetylase OafA/YrhL